MIRTSLLLLLCFPVYLSAQVDTTKQPNVRQHELALNFTFFVKQFVDFGGDGFVVSPYALNYKYLGAKNHGLRTGLGMGLANSKIDGDTIGFIGSHSKSMDLDFRAGYEYRIRLAKSWSMFVGLDGVLSIDNSKSKSESTSRIAETESNFVGYGGGPVLGVQVHFNDRISLFTESSFYFHTGTQKSSQVVTMVSTGSRMSTKASGTHTSFSFQLPTSVYLAVRLFKK